MVAKWDLAVEIGLGQEDAPAVFRHLHEAEVGPAVCLNADCRTEVNVEPGATVGPKFLPPLDVVGLDRKSVV